MRTRLLIACAIVLFAALGAAATAFAVVTPRVISGTPVTTGGAGATVALMTPGRRGTDAQFCGGTAIGPSAVLTAAHCVEGVSASEVEVLAGRARLSGEAGGRRVRVSRVVRAPGWDTSTTRNDAAVLLTARPLGATPVALAGSGDGVFEAPGRLAALAGWGLTSTTGSQSDDLRVVGLPIRSAAACTARYGSDFDSRIMLCVGGQGPASCNGDSGGPLMVASTAGVVRQVGIVSFGGERCGQVGLPDVYTRVRSQLRWIRPLIGGMSAPATTKPATTARARFGRIRCGPVRCRVEVRVRSDQDVSRLVVRARRGSRVHVARARRVSSGRWLATLRVPSGNVTLGATPLRADGRKAGRQARLLVELG